MDIKKTALLGLSAAMLASASARADDDDERHYRKAKSHREVHHHHHYYHGCPPPPAAQAPQPPLAQAPGFPRESASERGTARQRQRDILLRELATEEQLLERAGREAAAPETVEQHQRNIDALRRELGNALR